MADSKFELTSPIPTGPWTLYFHSPEETKWTLNTFVNLGAMRTWADFWTVIEIVGQDSFADGMFFMMRDPAPPLWENHQHIRGGCYSFRCPKKDASDVCIAYMIACMLGGAAKNSTNRINGISISPKRGFNIIKIWNSDAGTFESPSDINTYVSPVIKECEIIYTRFVQKKM